LTSPRAKTFAVLLAGYFGFGNLGDELLAEAAVKNLEMCGVSRDKIAMLSNSPKETKERFGIEAFNRWELSSVFKALGASRSMILPGGGLFQDASSARSCLYYWGLVRAAAAKRVPTAALGQSVGPLSGKISRSLARDAFSRCAYVAARDLLSADMLKAMRISCETMPDPVMSLDVKNDAAGEAVLVNLRPTFGSDGYARPVLRAARTLAEGAYETVCVAMSGDDAALMADLQRSGDLPRCEIATPKNLAEFEGLARRANAAVGMRLHFGILSVLSGLNVALSPYDPKVASFADAWDVKQLKSEENNDNFDIMQLLTNSWFRDKRKFEESRLAITGQFRKALELALGENNGRC
jgi:polysaccharide pyruvyl transferase CsaB